MAFSLRNTPIRKPDIAIATFTDTVRAVTLLGRRHKADGTPCQDFHLSLIHI